MKKIVFISILLMFAISGYSQNTVWLIDGTVLKTNKCKIGKEGYLECFTEKGKQRYTDTAEVFAFIVDKDTTFIYDNPDYPIEKAKMFMRGQIDGKEYNNYYVYAGGFALGVVTPFAMTYTPVPTFLASLVSVGYVAGFSSVNPNGKFCDIPEEYVNNEDYIAGYKLSATRKKIRNTSIFSVAGLAVGYAILFIVKP